MSLCVIYIHGFNSSPKSIKAQQIERYFNEQNLADLGYQLLVPALDYAPQQAMAQLHELIRQVNSETILLIGSSLGGYYSLWLAHQYQQCRAVLVNPAVYPYRLLADLLGENENIYSGQKYTLTTEHIAQLLAIDVANFADVFKNKERLLLLSQMADETLNYQEAVDKLVGVEQRVTAGGNHSFENFDDVIEDIFLFGLKNSNSNNKI
ncbi:YqiA/YcfP family alpha/beta fold hydrolase [Gammaproteobacteria bacterium AS21]